VNRFKRSLIDNNFLMKTKLHLIVFALFCSALSFSQAISNSPQKPSYYGTPTSVIKVPSIASRTALVRPDLSRETVMQDGRASKYDIIPGKGSTGNDPLVQQSSHLKNSIATRNADLVFVTAQSSSQPTDPAAAVGPDHYITVTNTAFQVFDKSGISLTNGLIAPNPTIFSASGCCDLTASYDNAADRYVLTFLGSGVQIAVSDGPDPVNDGWTVYTYSVVNDYQKLSVWRDGYYMTENTGSSNKIHVFERDKMIAGDVSAQMVSFALPGLTTSGFHSPQFFNIASDNIPTEGGAPVVYLQDDSWNGVSTDHIKMWLVDMDWTTVANSQVSAATQFNVTAFNSVFDNGGFSNLTQPNGGTTIDALQATIMNQATFRKFGSYNSAVFNFVVDVDGTSAKQAGIRWYEMRQDSDGGPWTIFQEGTYTGPDNRHVWNASMSLDILGNIGMGYTGMSSGNSTNSSVLVGSYFTGRYANDPLGVMTVAEGVIFQGNANIPGTRYGDYSKIDIDPDGGKKFWFVNEVMDTSRKNIAGVFQIAALTNNDVGVIAITSPADGSLSNAETVTVTVFNYGLNVASNFDVTYQVDGGALVTETFTNSLASNTSAEFTFATSADLSTVGQTYSITASTAMTSDEDANNDSTTVSVTHLFSGDVGVTAITAPTTGQLGAAETVTVTITNFGAETQTSIPLSYSIDGGTSVNETYTGSIAPGATVNYTFTATADLSIVGSTYLITATTDLNGDGDDSNDSFSVTVNNVLAYCEPNATNGCNIDGIKRFVLVDIDADDGGDGCNGANGYENRTDLSTDLVVSATAATSFTLQAQHNWTSNPTAEKLSVWIDFDDSGTFETSERLISGVSFVSAGQLNNFTLTIPANAALGSHTLRAKAIDSTASGNILEPCSDFAYGEVQDYTVVLTTTVGFEDLGMDSSFQIVDMDNNQFEISLPTSEFSDQLELKVYNSLGQQIYWRSLFNETGLGYQHQLNMSYMSAGVYIVTIGNTEVSESQRIIVK